MKHFIFALLVTFTAGLGKAQTIDSEVKNAITSGNASTLSSYFHSTIDLTVGGSEGTYSKSQAQQILSDFFATNIPSGYEAKHTGNSGDNARYFIGTLFTSRGNFRVYILLKTIGGKELIQTLRFESQS